MNDRFLLNIEIDVDEQSPLVVAIAQELAYSDPHLTRPLAQARQLLKQAFDRVDRALKPSAAKRRGRPRAIARLGRRGVERAAGSFVPESAFSRKEESMSPN